MKDMNKQKTLCSAALKFIAEYVDKSVPSFDFCCILDVYLLVKTANTMTTTLDW